MVLLRQLHYDVINKVVLLRQLHYDIIKKVVLLRQLHYDVINKLVLLRQLHYDIINKVVYMNQYTHLSLLIFFTYHGICHLNNLGKLFQQDHHLALF